MLSSRRIGHLRWLLLLFLFVPMLRAYAQETVFDEPSADILAKGKVYGELDGTLRPVTFEATFTPRVVLGIGSGIEVGMNFNGPSVPDFGQLSLSPTIKWRPWDDVSSGWSFYCGSDVFFPVRMRTYDAGAYIYASFAKSWKSGTTVTFGGYDYTRDVVAPANRAGGEFSIQQPISRRWTFASEWYTGKTSVGYVNTGLIVKVTSKVTLYSAYQIGNYDVTKGNHQFLWEIGYNFN
ncbi:MAG TPA: hypothetical protein VMU43_08520 [Candidatus Acidoferrum sp.]|nr:hypothetical protein [Candidatus Acidoferrum sp.]